MTKAACLSIGSLIALSICPALAEAQNPPQKPQSMPSWASPPQASQADLQNFPHFFCSSFPAIKAAALNDDYAYRQLAHLTENIGPRPSGSPQARAAAEYVAAELRQLGLEVRLQPVTVPHWVRGAEIRHPRRVSRHGFRHHAEDRSHRSWRQPLHPR